MPPDGANLEPGEPQPPPPRGWPPGFGESGAERDALLVLSRVELTPRELHALVWRTGSAVAALAAIRDGSFRRVPSRGAGPVRDRGRFAGADPAEVRRGLESCGAVQLTPADPSFPERLLDLPDPPAWLFVRGRLPDRRHWVTVVGARRCSAYGNEVAIAIGRGLAAAGVVVVSGAASGIDGAAHRGALSAHGDTVAVLGSGIDVPYPSGNRRLIAQIAEEGGLVSEYPPGTPAAKYRFPARNRIVAALGKLVVVVEGAEGSGSRITADFALDIDRDVLCVPGPVTSPLSAVPHDLIRDGAGLVRGASDVLHALRLSSGEAGSGGGELPEDHRRALEALAGSAATLEEVVTNSGLPAGDALGALMALEIRGLVRSVGGRYERTLVATGLAST